MAENNWKSIWNNRVHSELPDGFASDEELFVFMKRLNGFDTGGGDINANALFDQLRDIKQRLCKYSDIDSLFEVGCGSGANLLMFGKQGLRVGGIDYSEQLVAAARHYLKDIDLCELSCGGADGTDTSVKYDAVLSNSVFSYFADYDYAAAVLDKMIEKSRKSMLLIDVHDAEKKDAFIAFRKAELGDEYEKRYAGLPKLFYPKSFFENAAQKHSLEIEFYNSTVDGYWNNDFVFNVALYRR